MTTSTLPTTDHQIQQNVQDELAWTPDVDDAGIGVAVEHGTVTLSGQVDDYSERLAAKRAAFRTSGVTTVVDDLVVHPASYAWTVTATDIAKNVENAIAWVAKLPNSVRATVDQHVVTLTGEVEWNYQRATAVRTVERIKGVVMVVNEITLRSRPSGADTAENIRKALVRNATFDAARVHVTTSGTTVTLTGQVRSYVERKQAEAAAWSSPHVTNVIDDIRIVL